MIFPIHGFHYVYSPFQPTERIDRQWVSAALKAIDKQSTSAGRKLSELRSTADSNRDVVGDQMTALRGILTLHHNLMSDVRSILRTLQKVKSDKHFALIEPQIGRS